MKFLAILIVTVAPILACKVSGSQPTALSPGFVATTVAQTLEAITPLPGASPLASPTAQATATIPPTATALPPTATVTLTPVPPPTNTRLPGGTRINFAFDATAGIVEGQIRQGQVKDFLLGAAAGQPLIVSVSSLNNDVTFSVTGQKDGIVLLPPSQKSSSWQTMLTTTQDYLIQIAGGASTENFTLNVSTPARITFAPGTISAQFSGSTPGGLNVAYVLRARAGQKMKLKLDSPGGNAVLSVYGYQDGQPYLRYVVEQTTFDFTLPATEDYIIQVVPRAGAVVSYTLSVQVK
jgi:hypothetical protein